MFTAKFIIRKDRKETLCLRIISNRKKTEIALGFNMSEDTLADCLSPKPRPQNILMASTIAGWVQKIAEVKAVLAKEGRGDDDVNVIKGIILESFYGRPQIDAEPEPAEGGRGTFASFFERHAASYEKRSTRESNEYTISCIKKFVPDFDSLNFEDISYAWLSDFEAYMSKSGLSVNTRRIHFANIRAAINEAYKRELTDCDPFRRFKLRKEKTAKRSLTVTELRKLFNYETEPHATYYRDMFKLIFMLIGINTIDLYGLQSIDPDGRLSYRRAKTGRLYSIKVEPEMAEIIEKYRGITTLLNIADKYKDHRYFRRDTNDALRLIGEVKRVGRGGKKEYKPLWPEVTTYWARHTWATIASDLDIPDATISMALGHSGENATTDIYIKRNMRKVDEANRKVLDWVLYGKR